MCFVLIHFALLIIGITSVNEESTSPLEKGKKYLAEGSLLKAKKYASESQDKILIKQVHQANSLYQLATSNKASLQFSMSKYVELIKICHQSKEFHMKALNISLRLNNDTLFDSIYKKLKNIAPEEIEILAMKGFKNFKNKRFSNAKTYFNEYNQKSSKYLSIIKDINLLEQSIKKSIEYISKNQTEKSLKFLYICRKIMKKYSISDDSILSKEIQKIDIDIFILTEKYEDAIKQLNELISKTNKDEFLFIKRGNILYIHKDYSGCISNFEKALELTKDKNLTEQIQIYLNNAKILQENERRINYYEILGLKLGADLSDVKKSYRKMAVTWHPDRFKEILKKKEAEKKMKFINRAFDIIGNEESKHIYDFCHGLTDIPPVFEEKRGFWSKLLNLNQENVLNKCYSDDFQYTEKFEESKTNDSDKSDDSSKSSENVNASKKKDNSFESNYQFHIESNETDNSSESNDNSDSSIFNWIQHSIIYEITRSIVEFIL